MPVPLPKIKKVSVDLSAGEEENGTRKQDASFFEEPIGWWGEEVGIMRKIREGLLEKRKVTKKVKKFGEEGTEKSGAECD